jgi:hypothetical protein
MFPLIAVWPADWKEPPAEIRKAVEDAAEEYGIQPEILYGIGRRETQFTKVSVGKKHGGNNKTYARSYTRYKDQPIPGSTMTWGEMFTAEQWRPYGFMQLNPYHLVGKGKPFKAGTPLTNLFDVRAQARAAAALLVQLYKKADGDWTRAILLYNGDKLYRRDVALNISALREANGIA